MVDQKQDVLINFNMVGANNISYILFTVILNVVVVIIRNQIKKMHSHFLIKFKIH